MAAIMESSGNKHLKLRRHTSAANAKDLQDVEHGKECASSSECDHDDDHSKKDDDFVLARRSAEFLSGLSPLSRRIVRCVTPGQHPALPDRCTPERLRSAAARIIPALAALLTLPCVMWDGYPEEWGIFNLYPFVRHVDIVWSSLLHTSVWPILACTLLAVAVLPRDGVGTPKYLPRKRAGAATDRLAALTSTTMANVTRSTWKTSLFLSIVFCSAVLVNMSFQMGYPHALWNPFMWGWYRVYYPSNISRALKGACLDFEKHSASRQPLCLMEHEWDELSSGKLSSYNPDDVLTVQKGLDYLQNHSGGLIINALARNVADSIPALKQNMEGLAPFFKDPKNKLSLVVFENDSKDETRQAFQSWADQEANRKEPRYQVDLMNCGPKNPDCDLGIIDRYDNTNLLANPTASGVGKLGEFRQILLEYILGKEEYKDYSHMIILDVDLGTSISPLGLLHTLGLEDGTAQDYPVASSSSQVWPGTMGTIIPPYDLSAFRPKETPANRKVRGMHKWFCDLMPVGDRWRNMCEACSPMQLFMIQSANDVTNHHEQPYEVVSAFNGLTIYPMSLIRKRGKNARYDSGDDHQRCEHVGFHMSLSSPMYVNPKWSMNLKPNKPGGPTGFRAIKTLTFAVIGRPNIMLCVVVGDLVFFFLFVYLCFVIGIEAKSLLMLLILPREKKSETNSNNAKGRDRRDYIDASGIGTREM